MASILCNNGAGAIGWRDEDSTAGLWKLCTDFSGAYWHYNQDSGWWYLTKDEVNKVGWRNKTLALIGF